MGGDETRFRPELFGDAFAFVRSQGMHTVAHAGEAAGAQSVRAAVEIWAHERIGHGMHALRDPRRRRSAARTPPDSARNLPDVERADGRGAARLSASVRRSRRAGCVVTIDADDPALFGTSIGREYALVEQVVGENTLTRYVRNAVDASFAASKHKASHARALGRGTRRAASNVERTCPGIVISPNRSRSISKRSTASSGRARASPPQGLPLTLGVAPASVSGMLKKLERDGYVEYVARGEVKLSRSGLEVAVRVLRRHRLAERLLTDVLGMPWDEVHEEACMLEHAISDRVEAATA